MTVGMNTINAPTFLIVTYTAAVSAQQRLDSYCHFDVVLDISEADMVARY